VVQHTRYLEALVVPESKLHRLPAAVRELPTQDVFVHPGAVRSFTPHQAAEPKTEKTSLVIRAEVSTTTSVCLETTLPVLFSPFLDQYRGAKARSADRGPGWWTQGGASLQKLVKGVQHRAAPNELVLPWAQANKKSPSRQTAKRRLFDDRVRFARRWRRGRRRRCRRSWREHFRRRDERLNRSGFGLDGDCARHRYRKYRHQSGDVRENRRDVGPE
jgi:hypothetical protein